MFESAPRPPFGLRRALADAGLVIALAATHERVGLAGLLAGRGRRARAAAVPARAAVPGRGYRWDRSDRRDRVWWPQGVDIRDDVIAVSWYAKPRGGREVATRLSFVDLRDPRRPRYHHVLLVEAVADPSSPGGVRAAPVSVHAGGIAWIGGRIHVADTFGGLRVFEVADILRVTRPGGWRARFALALDRRRDILARRDAVLGFDHVLPQSGGWTAESAEGARRLRYSFVSLEHDEAAPHLVAGEYRNADGQGRLVRMPVDAATGEVGAADGTGAPEVHEPGIERMQGACVVDGTWYITTSQGTRRNGDLWTGAPGALVRHRGVLPRGPEDLARQPSTRLLWSVTEQPGARWLYAIDADAWRPVDERAETAP